MSKKRDYYPPILEEFLLSGVHNLLETLSLEGDIDDWIQENPEELIDVE